MFAPSDNPSFIDLLVAMGVNGVANWADSAEAQIQSDRLRNIQPDPKLVDWLVLARRWVLTQSCPGHA